MLAGKYCFSKSFNIQGSKKRTTYLILIYISTGWTAGSEGLLYIKLVLNTFFLSLFFCFFGPLNKKVNLTQSGGDEQETSDNNIPLRGEPTKNATFYTILEYLYGLSVQDPDLSLISTCMLGVACEPKPKKNKDKISIFY